MRIAADITQAPIEALDMGFLRWLSRPNEGELDAGIRSPRIKGTTPKRPPVVERETRWCPPDRTDGVAYSRDRGVRLAMCDARGDALVRELVDYGEYAKHTAADRRIAREVDPPRLVRREHVRTPSVDTSNPATSGHLKTGRADAELVQAPVLADQTHRGLGQLPHVDLHVAETALPGGDYRPVLPQGGGAGPWTNDPL